MGNAIQIILDVMTSYILGVNTGVLNPPRPLFGAPEHSVFLYKFT